MRTNKMGIEVPETLGEYYDFCVALGGMDCEAVQLLEEWLEQPHMNRDTVAKHPDEVMQKVLIPRIARPRKPGRITELPAAGEPTTIAERATPGPTLTDND